MLHEEGEGTRVCRMHNPLSPPNKHTQTTLSTHTSLNHFTPIPVHTFYSSSTVNSGLAPNSWPVLHYSMLWGCALLIGLLLNSNTECKNMARITQCEEHAGDRGCKSVYEPNFMHARNYMHAPSRHVFTFSSFLPAAAHFRDLPPSFCRR